MSGSAVDETRRGRRARQPSPRRWHVGGGATVLTAALFVVALPLLAAIVVLFGPGVGIDAEWLVLLVLFAAGDRVVAHLPTSRGAHTFTLREIPAVLGLALLEPAGYVVAYVLGAAATALLTRPPGSKLAFNIGLFLVEASAGVLLYHLLLGSGVPSEPRGWLAAIVTVVVTDLVSAMAVTAAIRVSESRATTFRWQKWVKTGLLAVLINTSVAILVLVLLDVRPMALLVLAFTTAVVLYGYRQYIVLVDGYARLQTLYRFVGSTGRAAELDDVMGSVLAEAGRLLRAERAELVMLGQDGAAGTIFRSCPRDGLSSSPLREAELASAWWATAATGTSVLMPSDARDAREARDADAPRDGIAVPLETEGYRGVFLVADRTFEKETFRVQDLQLFETLSAHAAVTLEKARLVDRLRRVAAEREHDALHDALTGLPNRRAFNEAVARTLSAGTGGAVLLMDLDDFKDVNDTLGHRAGDELLQVTGRRLRTMVVEDRGAQASGTVARLGGDEFAVLLPGVGPDEAVGRARELLESVTAPVPMQDITLTTTASIGVAPIPLDARDSDELLVHADVAMYAAKAAGTGVAPYVPEDTDAVHRRLALAGELPSAIEQRAFEVWCQPQVDARSGAVTGVEALLRWWHPSYGWVPPTEVVAIAERTGVLGRLTLAVLGESLRLRSEWARAGHELDISVNVTARDISDLSLPGSVGALLAATGTPPSALVLEITESGVMSDPERSMEVLAALHRLGVGVSVDDFGTGHSSLAYLERLPVNEVKIDQSFVKRLEVEATDSTVVRSIVLLAHDLRMRVVAEGVESDVARQRVQALGCELVQGFVIARPMPGDQVPGWVSGHPVDPLPG